MKIKTADLQGAALDWAVAKCEGLEHYFDDGFVCLVGQPFDDLTPYWMPTKEWAQGGPIIEQERIDLRGDGDGGWVAYDNLNPEQTGPTPLIAAMRCYVASMLGDEVDVPEEVTP